MYALTTRRSASRCLTLYLSVRLELCACLPVFMTVCLPACLSAYWLPGLRTFRRPARSPHKYTLPRGTRYSFSHPHIYTLTIYIKYTHCACICTLPTPTPTLTTMVSSRSTLLTFFPSTPPSSWQQNTHTTQIGRKHSLFYFNGGVPAIISRVFVFLLCHGRSGGRTYLLSGDRESVDHRPREREREATTTIIFERKKMTVTSIHFKD